MVVLVNLPFRKYKINAEILLTTFRTSQPPYVTLKLESAFNLVFEHLRQVWYKRVYVLSHDKTLGPTKDSEYHQQHDKLLKPPKNLRKFNAVKTCFNF